MALNKIGDKFSVTILGFPKWFLGVKVSKDDTGNITLDQSKAAIDLLQGFNMDSSNFIQVPFHPKIQLIPLDDSNQLQISCWSTHT